MTALVSDYRRIAECAPIDKAAHRVSKRGFRYEITGHPDRLGITRDFANTSFGSNLHFKAPPLLIDPLPVNMPDLRGMRYGSLVVVGLHHVAPKNTKGGRARWLCRCDCGDYETRSARGLRDGTDNTMRCGRCQKNSSLRTLSKRYASGRIVAKAKKVVSK